MNLRRTCWEPTPVDRCGEAAPSTEVRNESMQVEVESRTRAPDTATEEIDPRMEGNEGTADDDVTIAAGQVPAGRGDDLIGKPHCQRRTRDRSGPVPLEDRCKDDVPWYWFCADVSGGFEHRQR